MQLADPTSHLGSRPSKIISTTVEPTGHATVNSANSATSLTVGPTDGIRFVSSLDGLDQ